jgi:hypothetical protein
METRMTGALRCLLIICAMALAGCEPVDDPGLFPAYDAASAAPPPERQVLDTNPLGNLYWGDLHIHTSLSTDAFTMGVRALPDDAWRFARGGTIEHGAGYAIRLREPLDFAAVTDHAEYLGVLRALDPDLPLSSRSLRERLLEDGPLMNTITFLRVAAGFSLAKVERSGAEAAMLSAWRQTVEAAERHNDPGRFSAFIGYEWSSMPEDRNLHRNVIFRGAAVPVLPFSSLESEDPRELWRVLEQQREAGMDNMAIPHNGNVSGGLMYDRVDFDGAPLDAGYAERRMRNEPLSEILQVKGSSETHPLLSPDDAFAGFEIFDQLLSAKVTPSQPQGSYARDALRTGIEFAHAEGFNPYRFGVIGSSDSHNASSSTEEYNYHGKLPLLDGSAAIRLGKVLLLPEERQLGRRWSAAGLAAVWAPENTREALFDAMRRKETYATSGPRIRVRFFGGWDYPEDLLQDADWVARAYAQGVPMGGDLPASCHAAPRFAVWAAQAADSGKLERIQIIKGWIDATGASREQVHEVALAATRAAGAGHAAGNTADAATADGQDSSGAQQLQVLWTDPDFDPARAAFYYARVIEVPTPRWSTFDAATLGIEAPEPVTIQERAITSAIWYQGSAAGAAHDCGPIAH